MVTTTSSKTLSLQTEKIIKEINWPLLTSISIHGLFFTLIFPQWNPEINSNGKIGDAGNTPVVELNTIEQTRLPDLNPRNSFNWDSLTTIPPIDNSLPPLSAINIPTPPSSGNAEFFLPSFDSGAMANLPSPPSLPPSTNFSPINESYSVNLPNPTDLPPPPSLNENAIATLPSAVNYDIPRANFETPTTGKVIDINADPDQDQQAQIRQKLFSNSDIQITANPRDIINGRIPPTYSQIDENGNVTILPPSEVRPNFSNVSTKLQKQQENTSDEDARKNYVAWAKSVETVAPQQLTLSGIYPKEACVGKLEGTATYGVSVSPSGGVVNSQLIKSSGYPLLNDQALKQIRARNFANDSGANQPYHVYVNFNYNSQICPSLSISNVGETSPVNPPTTTDVNTPPANNIQQTKTPSPTPKKETQENKINTISTPKSSPMRQSSSETKPVVIQESSQNSNLKLPVENKLETPANNTKLEVELEAKPSPTKTEISEPETGESKLQ